MGGDPRTYAEYALTSKSRPAAVGEGWEAGYYLRQPLTPAPLRVYAVCGHVE